MRELSATEAARRFSALLDAVEHRQETFVVTRGGKTVALIAPAPSSNGRILREALRGHPPDPEWATELRRLRDLLVTEERSWPD